MTRSDLHRALHINVRTDGDEEMVRLVDHRLPLIRLKELRRDLVLALGESSDALEPARLHEIASVQEAIAAAEAVIADIDAEIERDNEGERVVVRADFRQCA